MAPPKPRPGKPGTKEDDDDDNGGFVDSPAPCKYCEKHLAYRREYTFGFLDALFVMVSMGTFVIDTGTDAFVTYEYFSSQMYISAALTLLLIFVPSLVMQVFSTKWYLTDDDMSWFKWIVHILQMGPLYRYISVFKTGVEARKSMDVVDFERLYHKQNDVCMLRLFEAFMESAPQLLLQLYILLTTDEDHIWTGVSAVVSLISLSWSIAAYSKAHRQVREDKNTVSWPGLILQMMWRIGMILSRVVAIVFFASFFKVYTFAVLGVHWLVMTVWVYGQQTDFCESWCMERLFNCVIGVVYCFCFFNLKEGASRYRLLAFYNVMLLENSGLIVAWYLTRLEDAPMQWYEYAAFVAVWGGFVLGVFCMVVYYQFFHPVGHISVCQPCAEVPGADSECNHHQEEDDGPPSLRHHDSIQIFEVSELQKTRDSPLAFPMPRTPSDEYLDDRRSRAVEIVNMGKAGNAVVPSRAKSVLSHNHSEIASLHSLGLSGFTDDLLGHFDNAQLALNDDNDASHVATLPANMSSRPARALQTQSARNSPYMTAKARINRRACSASNSSKLAAGSSAASNKTNATASLEQLPDISLGSPPKSTDAAEVRKIYESILGFYKSKPISARKLFKSRDSIEGDVSGGSQVKGQGKGRDDASTIKTDSKQEETSKSQFEVRLEKEKSKQASLPDRESSKPMITSAQIREALQTSKQCKNSEEAIPSENPPSQSCTGEQSVASEMNLTKDEENLQQLMGQANQENYYHLVSNSLLTLNSTGMSDRSLMNQSKFDKHAGRFKPANQISDIDEAANQNPGKEFKVGAGKSKPQRTSTPLTVGASSKLSLQAQNPSGSHPIQSGSLVKGHRKSISAKENTKENIAECKKENMGKSAISKDKSVAEVTSKPLCDSGNIKAGAKTDTAIKANAAGGNNPRLKQETKRNAIRKERKSLTELHGNVNIAEKVFIFDNQY